MYSVTVMLARRHRRRTGSAVILACRYIQSTCATSGDGLYEGLDWLSLNITSKEVLFLHLFTPHSASPALCHASGALPPAMTCDDLRCLCIGMLHPVAVRDVWR